jgi:hypothetical protein
MDCPSAEGALKILHPSTDQAASQKASNRVKQELDAQLRIQHSALVCILDADRKNDGS